MSRFLHWETPRGVYDVNDPAPRRPRWTGRLRVCVVVTTLAATLLTLWSLDAAAQKTGDVRLLALGVTHEREISPAETHVYAIAVASNHYARVVIEQPGVNVWTKLYSPEGQFLLEVNNSQSWEHDECCFDNPNGMACRKGPLDALTGHDGNCVASWDLAVRLSSKGIMWRRNIDFNQVNSTGTVVFNIYCAPANSLLPPGHAAKCCSGLTRALNATEVIAAAVARETLVACR